MARAPTGRGCRTVLRACDSPAGPSGVTTGLRTLLSWRMGCQQEDGDGHHARGQRDDGGALTVFPVWTEGPDPGADYLPFALAEATGLATVGELPQPTVALIQAVNAAMLPFLPLEGEAVCGGQQDRVVVASALVPAGGEVPIPVACVEQRRWGGEARHHSAGRVPPIVRSDVAMTASPDRSADQGAVWDRVARYRKAEGEAADGSLLETGRQVVPADLPLLEGQRGVVIGIAGRVRSLEVFDRHATLAEAWPGILRAATQDAVGQPATPTGASAARRFIRQVAQGRWEAAATPALGTARRVTTEGAAGSALEWSGRTVHLATSATRWASRSPSSRRCCCRWASTGDCRRRRRPGPGRPRPRRDRGGGEGRHPLLRRQAGDLASS